MAPTSRDGRVTATLSVREELPRPAMERAETVRGTLESLQAEGTLDELSRREWPKRVPIEDCDSDVRDTYLAYTAWADAAGVSLAPFFATRSCYSPDAGTHTDWLVVPAFALAIRVDGDLAAVYPHSDGTETASVEDGIDRLRSGTVAAAEPTPLDAGVGSSHSTGANR
jgi:hypothetical protein